MKTSRWWITQYGSLKQYTFKFLGLETHPQIVELINDDQRTGTVLYFSLVLDSLQYIYIYIYNPLYTNWPITNADLPHVIIQYILYFICQKLYWTASGQLSNIGYIGQFQNEATGTLRTRNRRTKAVSMYLMKILSIFLHLRKILICFRIGWFL